MTKRALAILVVFLGACAVPSRGAEPKRSTVTFSSAVNWDFEKHEKLDAWRNTALVIRKTLAEWYPPIVPGGHLENSTEEALRGFFADLPQADSGSLSIVYLASHQTRGGRWLFPGGSERLWTEILAESPGRSKVPRVLIVDACHAKAADAALLQREAGASGIFYTGGQAEVVHELSFFQRFPIDLPRRYPAETLWLRNKLGKDWNGRVSYFGFVWLRTFLATSEAPRSSAEWDIFFHQCESVGREFSRGRGASLATALRYVRMASGDRDGGRKPNKRD